MLYSKYHQQEIKDSYTFQLFFLEGKTFIKNVQYKENILILAPYA